MFVRAMDVTIEPVGIVGGIITSVCVLPQVYRVVCTQSAEDVSPYTYILLSTGQVFWIVHGVIVHNMLIVIFNAISIFINLILLGLKAYYAIRHTEPRLVN
jgi:MtN3 and saliva related transmembrane protein